MLTDTMLYAWAIPAAGLRGGPDHTWVTTYDCHKNDFKLISDVVAAKQSFWFCWGEYHPKCRARGELERGKGNVGLAECLVLANVPSKPNVPARGTIFTYGVDGVCH